jgi:hypothetical protein
MRTPFACFGYSAPAAFVFGIAACGGSNLDPGAGNDPGTGTRTLAIDGSVHASPRGDLTNARTNTQFDTDVSVHVTLNGQTMQTGTVTITSSTGQFPLAFGGDNRWRASMPTYDEVYILDIESGPDNVSGLRIDGPDIHVFTAPDPGTIIDPAVPLPIRWDREDEADSAELRAGDLQELSIPDSGSYDLPAGTIMADHEVRQHTIRITRSNSVVPAGTVAGSEWRVTITNELDVVTAAVP